MIIYKVTNKINGKEYVGQTVKSLKQRKQKHISDVTKQRMSKTAKKGWAKRKLLNIGE